MVCPYHTMKCLDCPRPTRGNQRICDDCWALYEVKKSLDEKFFQKADLEQEKEREKVKPK